MWNQSDESRNVKLRERSKGRIKGEKDWFGGWLRGESLSIINLKKHRKIKQSERVI